MNDNAYAQAQVRLRAFAARDTERIADACRTLTFDHGHRTAHATLLFHGLSASPRQMIDVATALHERGHNVFVPRLPRHGYRDRLSPVLATMDSRQLKACADDAIAIAEGLGERVHVAGFSLGGLLTLYLAQTHAFDRAVALSPFLGVWLLPNRLRKLVIRLALQLPNRFYWWNPVARERQQPEHGYPRYATHAVAHSLSLADEVYALAAAGAPMARSIALVYNPYEPAVNNRAIRKLAAQWRATKPAALEVVRLSGMPMQHDIVEPRRYPHVARRVTARLVELIDV